LTLSPVPPNATNLTDAGYTLTNGVWSQTFGAIVVSFTISDQPCSGVLAININGDVDPADAENVMTNLGTMGYSLGNVNLLATCGQNYYGQTL